ncbi:MAG: rhodanese-like domain-containing protein [Akkermansiaceae bacterium]|nr:rhodanese-like domain-containing protein [Akkermansiaceae bacterium]NNM28082.1 rhodanese-like domain-containing protein [Akkermansiaceae bacterium]
MKRILSCTLPLLAALCTACTPPEEAAVPETGAGAASFDLAHVDPGGAATMLAENPGLKVLDVRTPEEFADGHLAGAINVDFQAPDFAAQAGKLDKETPYLVHCRSGRRSEASLKILEELGFQKIYHLDGGISAWEQAGKPLEK